MVNAFIERLATRAEFVAGAAIVIGTVIGVAAQPWAGAALAFAGAVLLGWRLIVARKELATAREDVVALGKRVAFAESRGVHEDWETGLGNRRQLEVAWDRCWSQYRRRRESFAVAMFEVIDADRPNKALRPAAMSLISTVLKGVTRAEDTLVRLEGRVFVVMLMNSGHEGITSLAHRVHSRLEGRHRTDSGEITIRVRDGAAVCSDRTASLDDLLVAASFDLHEAPPKTLADAWAAA